MNPIKKIIAYSSLLITLSIFATGCDILEQAQKMVNFTNCQFKVQSVDNVQIAGINVQNIKTLNDLTVLDAAKVMAMVATNSFPLTFNLNLQAKNPNANAAGMNQLQWILLIDNIQMVSGNLNQSVNIPANNGVANIPLNIRVDLKQVLKGKSADAIMNFGLNLAGAGNKPTRITMKLKPTIMVGSYPLKYPDYITIGTEFK
jgi:LEA14-like dessication related protein